MIERVWFTSDTHFGHKSVAIGVRGYSCVDDHDQQLIEDWNFRIGEKERVYHLGDVGLCHPIRLREILDKLNGQIYLILGNHDTAAKSKHCIDRFVWAKDYHYLKVQEQKIALCHYPFETWRSSMYGSWHLHGHCHGNMPDNPRKYRLDVGLDAVSSREPLEFTAIKEIMSKKKVTLMSHHNEEHYG